MENIENKNIKQSTMININIIILLLLINSIIIIVYKNKRKKNLKKNINENIRKIITIHLTIIGDSDGEVYLLFVRY